MGHEDDGPSRRKLSSKYVRPTRMDVAQVTSDYCGPMHTASEEFNGNIWGSPRTGRRVSRIVPRGVQMMPRPTILTQTALVRVASLVDQGRSAAEIADEMGCTLGTLRVRCSQLGISLRRRAAGNLEKIVTAMDFVGYGQRQGVARCKSDDRGHAVEQSGSFVSESSAEVCIELKVLLPQITTEQLRQRGALRGISGSTLASELLVTIAQDGLYDAVLDGS
jgi:hypothetical protein